MTCFSMFCIWSVRQDEMTEKELELDNKTQRGVKVGLSEEVPLEMPLFLGYHRNSIGIFLGYRMDDEATEMV